MLEMIQRYQRRLLKSFDISYKRYLYSQIDFEEKMIAIIGARGVGKTTLLFQYLKALQKEKKQVLYISLDYPFLSGVNLIDLVEAFVEEGGEYLLLDEVHRYPDFASYLKTIYDLFDLKVLFTSSSATFILNAKVDLSRRVILYRLNGFSFREYLEVQYKVVLSAITLEKIFTEHVSLAKKISGKVNILKAFKAYLEVGYYPFCFDKRTSYYQNLINTINLTIDVDLTSLGRIEQKYTYKLKKLLEVICESKPFEVNYSKIASLAEISRVKLYDYINYLHEGEMLLLLQEKTKGLKKINKPAKIYLHNTNLLYAYCQKCEIGTVRETFFANQVSSQYRLHVSPKSDFIIDDNYTVEIRGKSKGFSQLNGVQNGYVVADDTVIGSGRKVPLWLFGFLY